MKRYVQSIAIVVLLPRTIYSYVNRLIMNKSRITRRGMFTGIVEEMGDVISLEPVKEMTMWDGTIGSGTELTIKGPIAMDGAYLGCSICVNGACLTATHLDFELKEFKVGLAPETIRKTNLMNLKSGDSVNLERASEIGERNSGHFVQGHVDNFGTIIDKWVDGNSLFFKVKVSPDIHPYIVPKGFIAIDGTSLTVCDVSQDWFTFMLVEYTQKKIIIPQKNVGDTVNLEVDVMAKYAQSAIASVQTRIQDLESKVKLLEAQLQQYVAK